MIDAPEDNSPCVLACTNGLGAHESRPGLVPRSKSSFSARCQLAAMIKKNYRYQSRQTAMNATLFVCPVLMSLIVLGLKVLIYSQIGEGQIKWLFLPREQRPMPKPVTGNVENMNYIHSSEGGSYPLLNVLLNTRNIIEVGTYPGPPGIPDMPDDIYIKLGWSSSGTGLLGMASTEAHSFASTIGTTSSVTDFLSTPPLIFFYYPRMDILPISNVLEYEENTQDHLYNCKRGTYISAIDFKEVDIKNLNFQIDVYYDMMTSHSVPSKWFNFISNAVWRAAIGDKDTITRLSVIGEMNMPSTPSNFIEVFIGNFLSVLYLFIFILMIPTVVLHLVKEKELCSIQMMLAMGLKPSIYRITNYLFFYLNYITYMTIYLLVDYLSGFSLINPQRGVMTTLMVVFAWGHLAISFAWVLSLFVSKSRSANLLSLSIILLSVLLGFFYANELLLDSMMPWYLKYLLCIYPVFMATYALGIVTRYDTLRLGNFAWYKVNGDGIMDVVLFMLVQALVLMLVTYYLEEVFVGKGLKKSPFFCVPKSLRRSIGRAFRCNRNSEWSSVELRDEHERNHVPADKNLTLEVRNLTKIYGMKSGNPFVALDGVSLTVGKNECLTLLGPNGAGKTTLVSIVCKFKRETSGKVYLCGEDASHGNGNSFLKLGYCPQSSPLWDDLTAYEHLEFYCELKGISGKQLKSQVVMWLEKLKLIGDDLENKPSSEFSGGMKRRLAIACALIGDVSLVILDEPTCGLDPINRHKVWALIEEAKKEKSIIIITHLLDEAEHLSDRVALLLNGQICLNETLSNVRQKYCPFYMVFLELPLSDEGECLDALRTLSPGVRLFRKLLHQFIFLVPRNDCKLSSIYSLLESCQEDLKIQYWNVEESGLEMLFTDVNDTFKNPERRVINQKGLFSWIPHRCSKRRKNVPDVEAGDVQL